VLLVHIATYPSSSSQYRNPKACLRRQWQNTN
jgi:hypothetical protein